MSKTLYWLQAGACGGDGMSLINIESPNVIDLFGFLDIDVLWHPSLSSATSSDRRALIDSITSGRQPLYFTEIKDGTVSEYLEEVSWPGFY